MTNISIGLKSLKSKYLNTRLKIKHLDYVVDVHKIEIINGIAMVYIADKMITEAILFELYGSDTRLILPYFVFLSDGTCYAAIDDIIYIPSTKEYFKYVKDGKTGKRNNISVETSKGTAYYPSASYLRKEVLDKRLTEYSKYMCSISYWFGTLLPGGDKL